MSREKVGDLVDVAQVYDDWDEEIQNIAMIQAQRVSHRDPQAASLLMAHVVAAQEVQEEQGMYISHVPLDYNPLELYDFACHEWGWTPQIIDEMHYLTFFGMIRQANERRKREAEVQIE